MMMFTPAYVFVTQKIFDAGPHGIEQADLDRCVMQTLGAQSEADYALEALLATGLVIAEEGSHLRYIHKSHMLEREPALV